MSANEPVSHLSEAELRAMTADLDGIHHDLTMPALKVSLAEWTEDIRAQGDAGRDEAQRLLFASLYAGYLNPALRVVASLRPVFLCWPEMRFNPCKKRNGTLFFYSSFSLFSC